MNPDYNDKQFGGNDREANGPRRDGYNHNGYSRYNAGGQRQQRPYYNNGEGRSRAEGYRSNDSRGYGNRQRNQGEGYGNGYAAREEGARGGYRPRYNSYGQGCRDGYRNQQHRDGADGGFSAPRQRFNRGEGYGQRNAYGQQQGGAQGHYSRTGAMNGKQQRRPYNPNAKYSQKKRLEYKEEHYDPNEPVRLNKFLANAGVCSRRDADKYIEAGVVTVNGEVVTELGTKVLRSDEVRFHGDAVKMEKKVYVLLNKPKGYVTTSDDPQNRKTVMDLVRNACTERIYPVGRLDRNTTGVLMLTNDGELASKLTHPKFLKKKIYHVTTDQNVSAADLRQIAEGITLDDGEIRADAVEYASETDKKQIGIEIHSGRNRIVRRIFESLGYHVVKLDRVYFAGLTKKNVQRGDWRYLTEKEVNMLRMGAFE